MREGEVQAAILGYLSLRGDVFTWRNNTGAYQCAPGKWLSYGYPGSADILGVWAPSGRLLCIEVKRPKGGRQSAEQARFQENVTSRGGVYVLARSVADVAAALGPPSVRIPVVTQRKTYPR